MIERDSKATVTIEIDLANLARVPDSRLAMLWHVAQANPAPHGDEQAGFLVARVGQEIIRRWLAGTAPEMDHHQQRDYYWLHLGRFASYRDGDWVLDPDKVSKLQPPGLASNGGHDLPGSEYQYCGADLGRSEPPCTCNRRIAHDGPCSPEHDKGGEG
jgi:hypothetical protein